MNKGIPLVIIILCVWPIVVHVVITYAIRYISIRDWKNLQWHNIKLPWSKDND